MEKTKAITGNIKLKNKTVKKETLQLNIAANSNEHGRATTARRFTNIGYKDNILPIIFLLLINLLSIKSLFNIFPL
ncbi:MAG: hypothetical protein IKS60_05550 [Lachnospiraceae bacterium]|nr:hypothetical protein [Lachnospiraceae bacterium]MBR5066804.1 hypothetical protein [Lachnospiraceae bacterium]